MIASLGGAVVNNDGSRDYAGSGGLVGGLSMRGGGWAYFTGAGSNYNRFTPSVSSTNVALEETYGAQPPIYVEPPDTGTGTGGGGGGQVPPVVTVPSGGGGSIIPTGSTSQLSEPSTYIPVEPIPTTTIMSLLNSLLAPSGRTRVESLPPLFSFNPFTNESGGLDMKNILLLVALIVGGYFAYTKFIR